MSTGEHGLARLPRLCRVAGDVRLKRQALHARRW